MSATPHEPHRLSIPLPRPLWIGLATLVLVVTALLVQFGVPIYRQESALREIKRVGGHVETLPGGPQWLRDRVGDERMKLFDKVTGVALSGTKVTDAKLAYLKGLPDLKCLRLWGPDVTDPTLAHLRGLVGLQELWLTHTRVTDRGMAHLKGLTSLQTLHVEFTLVTSAGLARLHPQTTKDEIKIIEALETSTTFDFVDLPLEDCIAFLKDFHKIKIWIDRQGLTDEGMALDQPITLKLAGVKLRSVLMLLLEPVQLTYVVEDNLLKFVPSRMANNKLITHTYQVHDLFHESTIAEDQPFEEHGAPRCPPSTLRPGDVEATIKTTIDPESWDAQQGLGLMKYDSESGSLVIRQRPSAHEQILQLLSALREAKRLEHFHARNDVPSQ